MKHEAEVVMLQTKKASKILLSKSDNKLCYSSINTIGDSIFKPQHLYFISNDEIKEGDWVFRKGNDSFIKDVVYQIKKGSVEHNDMLSPTYYNTKCKKIIATTNEELGYIDNFGIFNQYPIPSDEFIENFCELGGIWKVTVDYENDII